ncbi:glycoside hydrolase family 15 protein [Falsiroseomonas sp. HW251]|uniref:glycoside hydrolase family 15 protein n=1 Tax=Falsiroseomonas sp. HW251 TaxID=3390998 RepID=UPI003D31D36A
MASRIEDYGLIGDRETAALIGRDGSIDWLCWPRFDSDAVFAALLGTPEHGRWLLAPAGTQAAVRRRYLDGALVLETAFRMPDGGLAVLTDFMPERGENSDVVRIIEGRQGRVPFRMELVLRFGYGADVPWVTRLPGDGGLRAVAGPDKVVLRTTAPLQGQGLRTVASFTVEAGQRIPFVLSHVPSHRPDPAPVDAGRALDETLAGWRAWSGRCRPAGGWTEAVRRSAITLRALAYRPTGGIVAAATTSLPEAIGGARNWDYRICWLRDATLTLLALLQAGYRDEAEAWRDWLLRATMGSPEQIQVMYGLSGERRLREWELGWLPGYGGSRPVRAGNAAHVQLQLDVFGELADAFHQGHRHGIPMPPEAWALQRALTAHLGQVWTQPDCGIWEVRSAPRHFTWSKVMAWAAVDRAVRGIEAFGLDGPLERWRDLRRRIHEDVCAHGYDERRGSFVQAYGAAELDASLLLLPAVGFLPPEDPRIRGTIAAVERELIEDGLVRRYRSESAPDGLGGGEGAFLACSFWLADAYAMTGRREEAVALFDRLLGLRNELGLLSEEYDPRARRMLGNFPQAFSHTALVRTAYALCTDDAEAARRHGAGAEAQAGPMKKKARPSIA